MTKRPNSRVNLDRAIERLFGPYEAANVRHGVARSLDEAVAWANELVGKLDEASREHPASPTS